MIALNSQIRLANDLDIEVRETTVPFSAIFIRFGEKMT
jgi:hypothetical protein